MLFPVRTLLEDWPGRFALMTVLALLGPAIVAAVVFSEPTAALLVLVVGGAFLGAPAMVAGMILVMVPACRHVAAGLVAYGAALGAIVFAAGFAGLALWGLPR